MARNAALPKMPAETYIDIFVVDRLVYVDLAEDYTQYQEFKSYRRDHAQPGVMKTDIDPKGFEKTKEVLQKIKEMSDGSRSRSTSTSSTSVSSSQFAKNICNQLDSYLRNSHYSSEYRHLRATPMEEVMPQILQYVLLAMLPKSPCRFEFSIVRGVGLFANQPIAANTRIGTCSSFCRKLGNVQQDVRTWPRFSAAGTSDNKILAYFYGPLSCLNGSCSTHANVEVDFHLSQTIDNADVICTTTRKIEIGQELLYNYTSDSTGVLTGHTEVMICAYPGCNRIVATV